MLKITLKPNERVVVNGCVLRNGPRRQSLVIENRADIVREGDLLKPDAQATPVSKVYFLVQTALMKPELREKVVPTIQQGLAQLATCFGPDMRLRILQAASEVSMSDFYKAMSGLRPVLRYEAELLAMKPAPRAPEPATGPMTGQVASA